MNLKTNKKIYIALFFIAFAFVFSSTYNPLNFRRMHVDSSNYITIAQGITRGYMPYRDFVDNKGPLTYLLSAPGLYLMGVMAGIWITELILICIAVLFAYKTALFFTDKKHIALLGTAASFTAALAFFTVCAGTEEYSLPFLMVSLYIFSRYYFSQNSVVSFFELIILGICFASAVLIKLNMFPLWAGFCAVVFMESILKRRFAPLVKYILGFCAGVMIVCIPVFLYLKLNYLLQDFFEQVIQAGAAKGFSGGGSIKTIAKNFFAVLNNNFAYCPFIFGIFMIITKYKNDFIYYVAYIFSYFLMVIFISISGTSGHYNLALIPFYIPMLSFFAERIYSAFSEIKKRGIIIVLFFAFIFSEGLLKYIDDISEIFYNDSGKQLKLAGKIIDDSTKDGDTIISLGINGYIYPFTKRKAASKYFYQGSGLNYIAKSREEFLSDILRKPPSVIAIFTAETAGSADYISGWYYAPVLDMIDKDYRLLDDKNGYVLYIKK